MGINMLLFHAFLMMLKPGLRDSPIQPQKPEMLSTHGPYKFFHFSLYGSGFVHGGIVLNMLNKEMAVPVQMFDNASNNSFYLLM